MDRIFLDANVLFSAAYRSDAGLLRLFKLRRITLVTSDYAAEEARRNLGEPAQRSRLEALLAVIELVHGTFDNVPLPARVHLPEDDLPILRAAMASRCTHLLTGNLRDFGPYLATRLGGVRVLRPATYLATRSR
jgi:predicted nucleic acid-binding protein